MQPPNLQRSNASKGIRGMPQTHQQPRKREMSKQAMREETERLVKEALERKTLTVKQGKTPAANELIRSIAYKWTINIDRKVWFVETVHKCSKSLSQALKGGLNAPTAVFIYASPSCLA